MSNTLAEDCGRLFEVGFNIGILTYIRQHEADFSHHLDTLYVDDLRKLHFSEMVKEAFKRGNFPLAARKRLVAKQWFMFFLQKGFLAGLNFFEEYLQSLHWQNEDTTLEIIYYQCSFCRENSIYTYTKPDKEEWRQTLTQLASYGIDPDKVDLNQHNKKGQFLHADTLMLLRYGTQWRILCVDLSVFSVTSLANMKDANDIEIMRKLLLNELGYIRSKSVFTNLSIDTAAGAPDFKLSQGLETYFTAFKRDDKESVKLIQAGSYSYDFYGFLQQKGILTPQDSIVFNVVGYTDRGINAMSVKQENIEILHTCANIYQRDSGEQEIQAARQKMLETIAYNAAESFKDGTAFISSIMDMARKQDDDIYWISPHRECEEDFLCSWDQLPREQVQPEMLQRLNLKENEEINLLDAHARLVKQALEAGADARTYLFLTGNPGIGKTTAITDFLKAHKDEGFLFFYVSPRKQVNLDIINKFRKNETGPLCGNVLALTSNANIIHNNMEKPTVHYYSEHIHGQFHRQGADTRIFFEEASEEDIEGQRKHPNTLEQFQEDRIRARVAQSSGVLNSICNALYANMQDPISNQIIATVSIQSLKKTAHGGDTLKHLEKIFLGAFHKTKKKAIPEKMRELSSRIRHIFIMVDEITGAESGVEFLAGISAFIRRYELTNPEHGFNTRVIVADASIVDRQVIEQHLSKTTYEPDKIYFRRMTETSMPEPLSRVEFPFQNEQAVMVNANSYPAQRLHITYKVGLEFLKYEEDKPLIIKDHLIDEVQKQITIDLYTLLNRKDVPQVIVYIQDKRRLARLIAVIKKEFGTFEKNTHYLEIHANISETDKENIGHFKNNVRVIFMTASASRGLSFPNTTHILVDIPRFEIEQNLMEIIQVIYRGRGNKEKDQRDKELHFYLSDYVVYSDGVNRELSRRESILNLLNILLILKTSIMTRIAGHGRVGLQRFVMIPIGGKSVTAAGETFPGKMDKLISSLRSEYYRDPSQKWLEEAYMGLKELFGEADFRLSSARREQEGKAHEQRSTYLSLLPTFSARFEDAAYNGFHTLLNWQPFEPGYISGGLLIVPLSDKKLQEHYLIQLITKFKDTKESDLWKKMKGISRNPDYPQNLRMAIKDAIELLTLLAEASPDKTQQLVEDSQNMDQYYALPLLTFMHGDVMKEYFSHESRDADQQAFSAILAAYIHNLYPVTNILPIGDGYREFPFVVFRSFNLKEARKKMFADSYLFISNEMNVLNLLLSYKK